MGRGERGVGQVVEQPELLAQQEGAVEAAVLALDLGERRELADRLVLGCLQERPAGVLDPAPGRGVRALVGVPLVAADLVDCARAEPHDVEGIEADLSVGDGAADGALVLAAHVDRDRADGLLGLAELGEERLQGGAVAARLAPHDRARGVVGDGRQVAVMAAIADLVDADADQALQAPVIEVIGDHARDDRADRVPPDPEQAGDRRERHLLRQPRHDVLEVARVRRARPRPRHRLGPHAARRAAQAAQLALDPATAGAQVEMAPALDAPVVDLQLPAGLPAPGAHAPATAQPNRHEHTLAGERDVLHAGAG